MFRSSLFPVLALAGAISCIAPALADDHLSYPSKPVKWVVPYAPGSASDLVARVFGSKLQERWGQPVVVENRPGAATNIGTEAVLRSPADGYTLLLTTAPLVTNPALFDQLPYDPARDLVPVSLLGRAVFVLLVPARSEFGTFADLVAYGRANPGRLAYGAPGVGTVGHLVGQELRTAAGVALAFVPYKGAGQLATDLAAGHVPLAIGSVPAHLPQLRSGQVRALVVFSQTRVSSLPDVPSAVEAGVPDLVAEGFAGVSVRAGTPREIVAKLATDFRLVAHLPEVRRQLDEPGTTIIGSSPEEYRRFLAAETARWAKTIRTYGIRAE